MSWHCFRVYGAGPLATSLRCGIEGRPELLHAPTLVGSNVLAFVAPDVLDHKDESQLAEVAARLEDASRSHEFVVVVSQVPPGWTRRAAAGRAGVYYQVDTIIVNRAIERILRPEQFVVGCADPAAPLPLAYQEYLAAHACPVRQMSYESAELAKCAINYFLAGQIKMSCELAVAAAQVGADWGDVARAVGGDARIGPHAYLRPGKTNQHLERDLVTVLALRGRAREEPELVDSGVPVFSP